jgi:hypothetical protein
METQLFAAGGICVISRCEGRRGRVLARRLAERLPDGPVKSMNSWIRGNIISTKRNLK